MVFTMNWTLLVVVAVCSLWCISAFAEEEQCQKMWDFSKELCCDDTSLGCFNTNPPFDGTRMPCCQPPEKVILKLYSRKAKSIPYRIRLDEPVPCEFSSSRQTVIIIHGWMSNGDREEFIFMKDAFLKKGDYNIIMVTWEWSLNYPQSAADIRAVGRVMGMALSKLVEEAEGNYTDMWCVGHSLGAHTCGYTGRETGSKLGRITGLDPAGPSFQGSKDVKVGLNPSDAQFVDIIHSDTKMLVNLGTVRPLGNMDFYANGLGLQPGCLDRRRRDIFDDMISFVPTLVASCSHMRAIDLFTESIASRQCISRLKCKDHENMPNSCFPCDGDDQVCAEMGYNAQGSGQDGIYYIETANNFPPHCQG